MVSVFRHAFGMPGNCNQRKNKPLTFTKSVLNRFCKRFALEPAIIKLKCLVGWHTYGRRLGSIRRCRGIFVFTVLIAESADVYGLLP